MAQRDFSADDEECEIINSKYLVYWPKSSQDSYNQKVSFPKVSLYGNLLIFHVFFSSTPSVLGTQRVKLTSHVKLIYWAIKMFDTLSSQINSSVLSPPKCHGITCVQLIRGAQGWDSSLGRSLPPWRRHWPTWRPSLLPHEAHFIGPAIGGNWILLFIYLYSYQLSW